jgi:hypothetical protein
MKNPALKAIVASLALVVLASCGTTPSITPPVDNTPVKCSDGTTVTPPAKCPVAPPAAVPIPFGVVSNFVYKGEVLNQTKKGNADTVVDFKSTSRVGYRQKNGSIGEWGLTPNNAKTGKEWPTAITKYLLGLGPVQGFITGDGTVSVVYTALAFASLPVAPSGQRYIPGDKIGEPSIGGLPVDELASGIEALSTKTYKVNVQIPLSIEEIR